MVVRNKSLFLIVSLSFLFIVPLTIEGKSSYKEVRGIPVSFHNSFVDSISNYFSNYDFLRLFFVRESNGTIKFALDGFHDIEYYSIEDDTSYVEIGGKCVVLSKNITTHIFLSEWFRPVKVNVVYTPRNDGVEETIVLLDHCELSFHFWDSNYFTFASYWFNISHFTYLWLYYYFKTKVIT